MHSSLAETRPLPRRRSRLKKGRPKPTSLKSQNLDAATYAANIQLKEQRQQYIYTFIALALKCGLLAVGVVSLINLGIASHQRVLRHAELASVLESESAALASLQKRFDHLFTIGGARRLMDEQDQWIAPNRVRVIWQ